MANSVSILNKIARDAQVRGLTVASQSGSSVVISNGSNNLTVSYVAASISSPQGGVDPTVSPFLGIGIANPGQIQMQSAISTAGTIADVIDGAVAAQVLCMLAGLANDITLKNSGSYSLTIRGQADLLGMGQ